MMAWMEGMVGILGLLWDWGLGSGCRVQVVGWVGFVGDWISVCQGLRSLISPTAGGFARCLYTFGISSGDEAPCLAPWLHPTPVG